MVVPLVVGFSDEDKVGTIQPHDDALVVTLRIGWYDVRRVMVDQGRVVDIMYPDLYNDLGLYALNLTQIFLHSCISGFQFSSHLANYQS